MDEVIAYAARLSPARTWIITALAVGVTEAVDYVTDPRIWFGPVYLLIICLPTWALGARAGFLTGFSCLGISIALNGFTPYPDGAPYVLWNMAMRILSIAIIAWLVAGMRRSYDREWRNARIDHLTGALTKRGFLDRMAASRPGWAVLAYCDLDGFKGINDCHGHAVGDDILRLFARSISSAIRATDSFVRIGGDEFLLYLHLEDADEGRLAIEQIHARVNAIMADGGRGGGFSTGAIILDPAMARIGSSQIEAADRLMYLAKQDGGHGLRIAGIASSPARDHAGRRESRFSSYWESSVPPAMSCVGTR